MSNLRKTVSIFMLTIIFFTSFCSYECVFAKTTNEITAISTSKNTSRKKLTPRRWGIIYPSSEVQTVNGEKYKILNPGYVLIISECRNFYVISFYSQSAKVDRSNVLHLRNVTFEQEEKILLHAEGAISK